MGDEREKHDAKLNTAREEVLRLHRLYKLLPVIELLTAKAIIAATPEDGALVLPVIAAAQAFAFAIANGNVSIVDFKHASGKSLIDEQMLARLVINDEKSWLKTYYATLHD